MSFFSKKENKIILCLAGIIIALAFMKNRQVSMKMIESESIDKEESEIISEEIMVHITGEVKNPGVVKLNPGDRLQDAVDACGGLLENADERVINLSQIMNDEDKVHISSKEEIENIVISSNYYESKEGLIDINSADLSELERLSGIGPALGQKIIDYREDIPFEKIEDIKNVNGIGEKIFENIKDMIIVK